MIKPLRIEILFTGLVHLVWLTLLAFCISGESPRILINFLTKIESGAALFLYAIIISISFYLGTIAENFVIAINYFRKNKEQKSQSIKLLKINSTGIWGAKSFFFSSFWGILFVLFLLMFSNYIDSYKVKLAILVLGILLLIATLSSLIY
ncbi:MAG: hypothetical protein P8Z35_13810, partial [Ignavibacteriaceae bacterium]